MNNASEESTMPSLRPLVMRKEAATLDPEFRLTRLLIAARAQAGLSPQDMADRMGTTLADVSRLERGNKATLKNMEQYAMALGLRLEISLAPR